MAGRPRGRTPRDIRITLRMTQEGAAVLDQMRGPVDRSAFIRRLIEAEYRRRGK